jgi:hypothetical protein
MMRMEVRVANDGDGCFADALILIRLALLLPDEDGARVPSRTRAERPNSTECFRLECRSFTRGVSSCFFSSEIEHRIAFLWKFTLAFL